MDEKKAAKKCENVACIIFTFFFFLLRARVYETKPFFLNAQMMVAAMLAEKFTSTCKDNIILGRALCYHWHL